MVNGTVIDEQDYLVVEDGHVVDVNWDAYRHKITRMKAAPAFDAVDLKSPENEEFGDEQVDARHLACRPRNLGDHAVTTPPRLQLCGFCERHVLA